MAPQAPAPTRPRLAGRPVAIAAAESRGGTAGVLVRVMAGVAIPGTSARNALIDC